MEVVYPDLRRMARRYLKLERPGHTLQATALVNEAYMLLTRQMGKDWKNRAHFFAIAAGLMRHILVDYARTRKALKRDGARERVDLETVVAISNVNLDQIVAVDTALARLAEWDPRLSKIVELRFFGGLTEAEVAEVLQISPRTVKRDWDVARAWLHGELYGKTKGERMR
jgi:RNA polymerase sigma factor (TIGR02999 family)